MCNIKIEENYNRVNQISNLNIDFTTGNTHETVIDIDNKVCIVKLQAMRS